MARIGPRLLREMGEFIPGFITATVPEKIRHLLAINAHESSGKLVYMAYLQLRPDDRHCMLRFETVGRTLQVAAAGRAYELLGKTIEEVRPEIEAFLRPIIEDRTRWPLDHFELNEPIRRISNLEIEPQGRALPPENDLVTLKMRNVSRDMYLRISLAIDQAVRDAPHTPAPVLPLRGPSRFDRDFEV